MSKRKLFGRIRARLWSLLRRDEVEPPPPPPELVVFRAHKYLEEEFRRIRSEEGEPPSEERKSRPEG